MTEKGRSAPLPWEVSHYAATRYSGWWWTKPWVVVEHPPAVGLYGAAPQELRRFRFRWFAERWVRICWESDEAARTIGEALDA